MAAATLEAIKEGRASVYKIRRRHCIIRSEKDAGRNPRTDFGDIPALGKLIAEHGIQMALQGSMEGKKFAVGHGERRLRAFDYAVEHFGLDPKGEKGLIPIELEGFSARTSDRDRLIFHVVLNEGKPLDAFEKATAMKRLIADHSMTEKEVAEQLGCSLTAVRDGIRLIDGAAPELQQAVASGKISATTAVDIIREVEDPVAQVEVLEKAQAAATAAGSDRVTSKHLPIATGKAAQGERRRGRAPAPFADNSTPDGPASDHDGNFTENVTACQIPFNGSKVKAAVLTALVGSTHHVGWRITIPGQGKGEGLVIVHPSVNGITADNEPTAILLGLSQIRAELELRTFKGKDSALAEIDSRLEEKAHESESAKPSKPSKPKDGIENPVIKDRDPAAELKEIIESIDAKDADKDRLATAKKVMQFIKGRVDGVDLTKYILGIQ